MSTQISGLEKVSTFRRNGKTITKYVVNSGEIKTSGSKKVGQRRSENQKKGPSQTESFKPKFLKKTRKTEDKTEVKTESKTEAKPSGKTSAKHSDKPLRIKITTPKEKSFVYVKSKTPYALISKGRVVKTTDRNKNKFYPYHVYIFKKNAQDENFLYLETTTPDGKKFLKKLFRTDFDELDLSCEEKSTKISLGTKFSYKRGSFKLSSLKA